MTFIELEKILKKDGWYYYDSVGSQRRYKKRNLECDIKANRD